MKNKIIKCPKCGSQNIAMSIGSDYAAGQENQLPGVTLGRHLCGDCGYVYSDNPLGEKLAELSVLFTLNGEELLIERLTQEKVILKVINLKKEIIGVFEFKGNEEVAKAEEYYIAFRRDN